jgi:hypothetical protein
MRIWKSERVVDDNLSKTPDPAAREMDGIAVSELVQG